VRTSPPWLPGQEGLREVDLLVVVGQQDGDLLPVPLERSIDSGSDHSSPVVSNARSAPSCRHASDSWCLLKGRMSRLVEVNLSPGQDLAKVRSRPWDASSPTRLIGPSGSGLGPHGLRRVSSVMSTRFGVSPGRDSRAAPDILMFQMPDLTEKMTCLTFPVSTSWW